MARQSVDVDHVVEIAHVVHPGQKMRDVLSGEKQWTKALCGERVTKQIASAKAPVCRSCFIELQKMDLNERLKAEAEGAEGTVTQEAVSKVAEEATAG